MNMKWSQQAWQAAEPVYQAILRLPFVRELADGTLPQEKFLFYLGQDAHYLDSYTRVLAHIASRLTQKSSTEEFLKFATDGIAVERDLHESFLCGQVLPEISPACLMYTSVLKAAAFEDVAVEASSVLPCFWVYQKVGEHILASAGALDANPYARWINTYGDEYFAQATARAISLCDDLADASTQAVRDTMTDIFITCTRMEWMFWDSAYNLEKWKI